MDFRGHVALGAELGAEVAGAVAARDGGRETKISDLEVEVDVVEEVLGLEVSVGDALLVHVVEAVEELAEIEPASSLAERATQGHVVEQLTSLG